MMKMNSAGGANPNITADFGNEYEFCTFSGGGNPNITADGSLTSNGSPLSSTEVDVFEDRPRRNNNNNNNNNNNRPRRDGFPKRGRR